MSGLKMKYFVCRPRSKDPNDVYADASREALRAYARVIGLHDRELSDDLRIWVVNEELHHQDLERTTPMSAADFPQKEEVTDAE
jgi:hypothetical protein